MMSLPLTDPIVHFYADKNGSVQHQPTTTTITQNGENKQDILWRKKDMFPLKDALRKTSSSTIKNIDLLFVQTFIGRRKEGKKASSSSSSSSSSTSIMTAAIFQLGYNGSSRKILEVRLTSDQLEKTRAYSLLIQQQLNHPLVLDALNARHK